SRPRRSASPFRPALSSTSCRRAAAAGARPSGAILLPPRPDWRTPSSPGRTAAASAAAADIDRQGTAGGGSRTDLGAVDADGRVAIAKSASTPEDPSIGVMDGIALLARELRTDRAALLGATDLVVHGTTVATNALLERKGAKVGMLTTEGHRDIIEMR